MDKIEVYWGDTQDGERHSVECSDERDAKAFATWLESTDGIIPDSVRVQLPEQRGRHAATPLEGQEVSGQRADSVPASSASPAYVPPIIGGIILRELEVPDAEDGVIGEEQITDGRFPA